MGLERDFLVDLPMKYDYMHNFNMEGPVIVKADSKMAAVNRAIFRAQRKNFHSRLGGLSMSGIGIVKDTISRALDNGRTIEDCAYDMSVYAGKPVKLAREIYNREESNKKGKEDKSVRKSKSEKAREYIELYEKYLEDKDGR